MRPTAEQIAATTPDRSNWVTANAGSGKTAVLTQRVARLLLDGAPPQRILCLTYTRAAANEMQTRLFRLLGGWTMASNADLAADLAALGGGTAPDAPEALADARRLFARALETPGGLRIQTIHSFCESLLSRFPLEAGVSPRVQVSDDRTSAVLRARVMTALSEAAWTGEDPAFAHAARLLNEGGIADLADAVMHHRHDIAGTDAASAIASQFGADAGLSEAEIAADALARVPTTKLRRIAEAFATHGGKSETIVAGLLYEYLSQQAPEPDYSVKLLFNALLTKTGTVKRQGIKTKGLVAAAPDAGDAFDEAAAWAEHTRARLSARRVAGRAQTLHAFGQPLLRRYADEKAAHGLLDYDDLIARSRDLLVGRAMRSWVLYKLDQGIDHILVDEAQDTAPMQWDVIAAIAEDFLSGDSAREANRTIFVVGDEKQSIYSFQGADPQVFGAMRNRVDAQLEAIGRPLGRPDLLTSFRSAPAVLRFVDAVFAGEAATGLTADGTRVLHSAHRAAEHGRVDLWPLVEAAKAPEASSWWEPVDTVPESDPRQRLASMLAAHVRRMIDTETLPDRDADAASGARRRIRPRDILILVTRRRGVGQAILAALSAEGVPVAGSDRLDLAAGLAVKDLLALTEAILQPSDDLSLAAVLRSPICGVSEEDLRAVAEGRGARSLRSVLRTSGRHPAVSDMLDDLAEHADLLRPFEFLDRILGHHGARRALIARLGPEAEDLIDELQTQAILYESASTPTLAGFVAWIRQGDVEVKREQAPDADLVRVMTVHGAKGLESPIVILPDTMSTGQGANRPQLVTADGGGNADPLTLWLGPKKDDDPIAAAARARQDARQADERRRLLYVALTRAESWLILCGAAGSKAPSDDAWYPMLSAAMERLDTEAIPSPTEAGEAQRFETNRPESFDAPEAPEADVAPATALPAWMSRARSEPRSPRLSPSGLITDTGDSAKPGLRDAETARTRGILIHSLLEMARTHGMALATRGTLGDWASRLGGPLTAPDRDDAVAEAFRVLAMPESQTLFGPDAMAEVTLAVDPPGGGQRMIGRADMIVTQPDRILVVDIKTDAYPAKAPDTVAPAYRAQLGAYRAALTMAWPDRPVSTAILWTAKPLMMMLPDALVDSAFANTTRTPRQNA